MTDEADRDFLEELERRALAAGAESSRDLGEENPDLLEVLRTGDVGPTAAKDLTLGGYIAEHDRPPAFEGSDGQPYTVGMDVEETGRADAPFVGFLVFIRWAATGAGIMAHVESGDLSRGATAEAATQGLLELSLYEIKAELDAAIARRDSELEDRDAP
jgi:hypothetical protein